MKISVSVRIKNLPTFKNSDYIVQSVVQQRFCNSTELKVGISTMASSLTFLTPVFVGLTVRRSLGCCGSEWRNWFPDQPVTVAAEAPVPPAAPVTQALSPVLTAALEKDSGPAVSPHTLQISTKKHTGGGQYN